jgi:hypothetical protein
MKAKNKVGPLIVNKNPPRVKLGKNQPKKERADITGGGIVVLPLTVHYPFGYDSVVDSMHETFGGGR